MRFILVALSILHATSAFVVPSQQHFLGPSTAVSVRPVAQESTTQLHLFGTLKKIFRKKTQEPVPTGLIDTKKFDKVTEIFPGAKTNSELITYLRAKLVKRGYELDSKTLCATSLCCDEASRPLETQLSNVFDTNFNMGGLAGFPWGGVTSFGAMTAHIPDGGSCVIVHGPHVGVDSAGNVGTVERRGRVNGGACCGSAVAASGYVSPVHAGEQKKATMPQDPVDAQQYFVGSLLMPYAEWLEKAEDAMVELPYALYDAQKEMMGKIIKAGSPSDASNSTTSELTTVLGGIQINTPPGRLDFFCH